MKSIKIYNWIINGYICEDLEKFFRGGGFEIYFKFKKYEFFRRGSMVLNLRMVILLYKILILWF